VRRDIQILSIYTYILIHEMTNGYCTLYWQASDLISTSNLWRNSTKSVCPPKLENNMASFNSSHILEDRSSTYITYLSYLSSFHLACVIEDSVKDS